MIKDKNKNKNNFEPANSKKLGNNEIGIINKIAQDGTRDQKIKRIYIGC